MGKIVIAGGNGFIGRPLAEACSAAGHEVVILSRKLSQDAKFREDHWDGKTVGPWASDLEGAQAIVNLSGESISIPWTEPNKAKIRDSRVESTNAIGQAIASCAIPPKVWVNGSAVGYYGDRGEEELDESKPAGTGFLAEICSEWESAARESVRADVRLAMIRTGVVLGRDGGAFAPLAKLTSAFLGGSAGDGHQWVPWIHLDDLVRLFVWAIDTDVSGPINGCGPIPVRNGDLMKALRHAEHRPWSPPVPAAALKVTAHLGGPDPSLLLGSTRAIPSVALANGFQFKYVELEKALVELVG